MTLTLVQQRGSEDTGGGDELSGELSRSFQTAIWDLVWAGYITNDTWTPVRALVHGDHQQRPRTLSSRRRRSLTGLMPAPDAAFDSRHYAAPATLNSPALAGRWSLLHSEPLPDTVKALAWTEGLLDRYAVVTRNVAVTEHFPGGFAALQPVLRGMEDSGRVVRGRFILGLGAAQFADRATVDRLRELAEITSTAAPVVAVSAVDPASPYGTILPCLPIQPGCVPHAVPVPLWSFPVGIWCCICSREESNCLPIWSRMALSRRKQWRRR